MLLSQAANISASLVHQWWSTCDCEWTEATDCHGYQYSFRFVNLILFTLLLVRLMLCMSPHLSHHLRSHHLSLRWPFTPDLKLISFTNPFLHSHSYSFQTAFTDLEPLPN